MAISVCLTLGMVFKQPLRQTQGLFGSLARLMELDIPVPDFSTLSRRGVLLQSFMGGFYSGPVVGYLFAKSCRREPFIVIDFKGAHYPKAMTDHAVFFYVR
jgi:hypothetical protein